MKMIKRISFLPVFLVLIIMGIFLVSCENEEITQGLNYTLVEDEEGYAVSVGEAINEKKIIIPSTFEELPVVKIGDFGFSSLTVLESIKIPSSVTHIGTAAFNSTESLTTVYLSEGLTIIDSGAFLGCKSLISIDIPSTVTTIGDNAFRFCPSLRSVNVSSDNPVYASINNGVLLNKNHTTLIFFPINNAITQYSIPETITTISKKAFEGCVNLTALTIPSSVTNIMDDAFSGCINIKSITIPYYATTIGKYVFYDWESSQTINVASRSSKGSSWSSLWNSNCQAKVKWNQ